MLVVTVLVHTMPSPIYKQFCSQPILYILAGYPCIPPRQGCREGKHSSRRVDVVASPNLLQEILRL
jgi:hypothetical protein